MRIDIRPASLAALGNLRATPNIRSILLTWTLPVNNVSYRAAQVWMNTVNDVETATLLDTVAGNQYNYQVRDVQSRYFWIRAVDEFGRSDSPFTGPAAGAASLVSSGDLVGAVSAQSINRDPNFVVASNWYLQTDRSGALNFGEQTNDLGAAATTCVHPANPQGTGNAEVWMLDEAVYPIDPARLYELSGYLYTDAGNTRGAYLAICFYDSVGTYLDTVGYGNWGGGWSGYPVSGIVPNGNRFTRYAGMFGASTNKRIPANATQCRVGVILNYGASGPSGLRMKAQGLQLVDVTAVNLAQTTADTAAAAAAAAQAAIVAIADNGILSRDEKPEILRQWSAVVSEAQGIINYASSISVDYSSYYAAYSSLNNYLPAGWNDTSTDTPIDRTDFISHWNAYYLAKEDLRNRMNAKAATTAGWDGVFGDRKPQDNATVGATIGSNLGGAFTSINTPTYFAALAIQSGMIADLRTANYAEDGFGVVTAGAKMASTGTAFKVANASFQIGSVIFTDYWARLVYAIDGSASSALIWRGNNDSTVRYGTANIACLKIQPLWSSISADNVQTVAHRYTLTPTNYNAFTDNLDSLTSLYIQWFGSTTDNAPFADQFLTIPSRSYNQREGSVTVDGVWAWRFSGAAAQATRAYMANGVYNGYQRVTIGNVYGYSQAKDFGPGTGFGSVMADANITGGAGGGTAPPPPPPEGGGTSGGNCPAPWVKIRLLNGKSIMAGDLYNGAQVVAVDDTTMQPLPKGGKIRDLTVMWAQRYRVTLTNGSATEWSENHRLAVMDRGWIEVQNIRPGDHILGLEECIVSSVLAVGRGQVISFVVEGAGTYFGDGMLCHNRKFLP